MTEKKSDAAVLRNTLAPLPETKRGYGTHMYAISSKSKKKDLFVYTNGRAVVVRELANPERCVTFTEHKAKVNCANFSPNGEWIASGDSEGKVLVWSLETMNVKNTVECGKSVNDITWDSEGKRIAAVGDGAENKARVFTWDSGNNLGEVTYHSGPILSVSYRPTRPFRLVTGGEDLQTNIYEGPPFKFLKSNTAHERYPNCTRYSPDGSVYVSVGSDQRIVIYDGTTGNVTKTIDAKEVKDGHKGAIYGLAWSPDGKQILTTSADKTAKLWNMPEGTVAKTFKPATTDNVEDMLMGALWHGSYMLVVALSGAIYYLDAENPNKPSRVLHGHKDNIQSLSVDRAHGVFFTSDILGQVSTWDASKHTAHWLSGKGHAKAVSGVAVNADGTFVASVGLDDKIRVNEVKAGAFSNNAVSLGGNPAAVAFGNKDKNLAAAVLAQQKVVIVREGKVVNTTDIDFQPLGVSFSRDDTELAVCGKNQKLVFFEVNKDALKKKLAAEGPERNVNQVAYAPNNSLVACVDSNQRIAIYEVADKNRANKIPLGWRYHSSNVVDVAFSPDSSKLATVSADESIIVWTDLKGFEDSKRIQIPLAHTGGATRVEWLDDKTLVTAGADRCLKIWDLTF